MNKVTLSWRDSKTLTPACREFMRNANHVKNSYVVAKTGDTVYTVLEPRTRLFLEFTLQVNRTNEEKYVNWARISGQESGINQFLHEAGSPLGATSTPETFVAPEF
jgi:hypothetical protein